MIISLIVAASENNVIGKENKLPWHQPEDLKYFKNKTWAMPVIMGRKTFESMGKALPGRMNIVITSNASLHLPGATTAQGLAEAISTAGDAHFKEIFITGGGEIFKSALPVADKIYLTRIHAQVDGDIFFPELSAGEWELVSETKAAADEKNKYAMTFEIFARRKENPGI